MDLFQIDKNMVSQTVIEKDGLVFYSPESEFIRLYGVQKTERGYCRMDPEIAKTVNNGVASLNFNTSGGRVRFITNSKRVAIIAERDTTYQADHMTFTNVAGFDIYEDDVYLTTFRPGTYSGGGLKTLESSASFDDSRERLITINFPCYGPVLSFYVGVEQGSLIKAAPDYKYEKPVVFYGSSITQGGCASRPGMTYGARFGRDNGFYCFNLGFSGKSKLQPEYARYLADIEADAFIFDTFSNPSAKTIYDNFDNFVDVIRAAHPETPLIFMQTERRESRNFDTWREDFETKKQAAAVKEIKERMKIDRHIYFIPSDDFLGHDHIATSDGSHPTDLGFTRMLDSISPKILKILRKYGIK